jgi:hypothetical protein
MADRYRNRNSASSPPTDTSCPTQNPNDQRRMSAHVAAGSARNSARVLASAARVWTISVCRSALVFGDLCLDARGLTESAPP